MFRGILIESGSGQYGASLKELDESQLPEGDVTVRIAYSCLNYKDCLAITGKSPIVKRFPMVPGVDLAGTVEATSSPEFRVGDSVVLNGWGVGESHWGGLAQKARVKSEWLIRLPAALSAEQAMSIGTAGYTAMLCVMALQRYGVTPEMGDIAVTGAAGGVGSVAVAILAKLGYRVVAISGRVEESEYLRGLGAAEVMGREEFAKPGRPLGKQRWAGAVDVVGSHVLANICATTNYGGVVAACGLAGGMDFPATVAPFILRGVTLSGIDSVQCPRAKRLEAWARLASDLEVGKLDAITHKLGLSEAIAAAEPFIAGKVRGRLVVDVEK